MRAAEGYPASAFVCIIKLLEFETALCILLYLQMSAWTEVLKTDITAIIIATSCV